MRKTFYSNGKLLLSGEYLVLDGAWALAVPTKFGQIMHVDPTEDAVVTWESLEAGGEVWFAAEIPVAEIRQGQKSAGVRGRLVAILHEADKVNPELLHTGFRVSTQANFPREWGLGTSSTLINNIADWFGIDAFSLLFKSFGGSGYDIACARNDTPILYRHHDFRTEVKNAHFNPAFSNELYFVFLNQKQNSKDAIAYFRSLGTTQKSGAIAAINELTQAFCKARTSETFASAMEKHEELLSKLLGRPAVKQLLFADFEGSMKSLGAWGGDFILVQAKTDPKPYFSDKGYPIVFTYSEMIK